MNQVALFVLLVQSFELTACFNPSISAIHQLGRGGLFNVDNQKYPITLSSPLLPFALSAVNNNDEEEQEQNLAPPIPTEWKGEILQSLSSIIDPDLNRDIVTLGFIQNINLDEATRQLSFDVQLTTPACPIKEEFQTSCQAKVNEFPWTNGNAIVQMTSQPPLEGGTINPNSDIPFGMSQVKSIIAVSSCKGGVGKSTTAVNLAYALSNLGASVGIFDADVYGPSLPTMVTPDNDAVNFVERQIAPLSRNGVKLMSFGYVNEGSAVMRGPMVTQLLDQFLSFTYWGPLDYLILDMPPGTGDIQLTLSQKLNITAAVIVTTPQELSFVDVERGIEMFDSVNVPCISVVENMAYLELEKNEETSPLSIDELQMKEAFMKTLQENGIETTNNDNDENIAISLMKIVQQSLKDAQEKHDQEHNSVEQLRIFGQGHKKRLSEQWGIEHTYSVPLMEKIAANGDNGTPFILEYPNSPQASIYKDLASSVVREVVKIQYSRENNRPSVNYNEETNVLEFSGMISKEKGDLDGKDDETAKSTSSSLPAAELRRDCKCAACVEEMTGRQILKPENIPDSVKPININPTGNYALSVDWSDGHRSLYPFRQIGSLLEDKAAEAKREEAVSV